MMWQNPVIKCNIHINKMLFTLDISIMNLTVNSLSPLTVLITLDCSQALN